ncbi:hypothetical protein [Alysiella sp.]|uniref:hypothetical protein n=1 Tax=Alysiella sp. TaxID=1872483 RepID=UPI0026DC9DD8|nr:hypothetical protein [Alysiella sp.]
MPIDPMQAARLHRDLRIQSQRKQAHHAQIAHNIMPQTNLTRAAYPTVLRMVIAPIGMRWRQ